MDKERYTNVILEEMRDQMQVVVGLATTTSSTVNSMQTTVAQLVEDVDELRSDVKIIKQVVTDTNKDLRLLERRVGNLEQQAA